jgi:hypothetical protein
VQPGLRSYGLPEQARERGESSTHRLSENVQRPETSAGITRQIVERDEAKLDLRDALQHLAAGDRDQLQPRRAVI